VDTALRVLHSHGDGSAKANDLDVLCPGFLPKASGRDLSDTAARRDIGVEV
jgi:hypothetical protein